MMGLLVPELQLLRVRWPVFSDIDVDSADGPVGGRTAAPLGTVAGFSELDVEDDDGPPTTRTAAPQCPAAGFSDFVVDDDEGPPTTRTLAPQVGKAIKPSTKTVITFASTRRQCSRIAGKTIFK